MADREQLLKGLGAALGIGGDYFSAKGGGGTPYADLLRQQIGEDKEIESFKKKLTAQQEVERSGMDILKEKAGIELDANKQLAEAEAGIQRDSYIKQLEADLGHAKNVRESEKQIAITEKVERGIGTKKLTDVEKPPKQRLMETLGLAVPTVSGLTGIPESAKSAFSKVSSKVKNIAREISQKWGVKLGVDGNGNKAYYVDIEVNGETRRYWVEEVDDVTKEPMINQEYEVV